MTRQQKHTGIAIAIAWPQTYCKQPGVWYDKLLPLLGINKYNYYKVGHAAVVLIDPMNTKCHYFDFGRYHSPFQHGRVRSAVTDNDLKIKTIPKIALEYKELLNYKEILNELQNNSACHGQGELYASYSFINFEKAFNKANNMQNRSPIPYGPFRPKGSNCSRFVCSVLNAGKPKWSKRLKLNYLIPFTPTPISNVRSFSNQLIISKSHKTSLFEPNYKIDKNLLHSTLPQPARNRNIPQKAHWLSGEGAGSWFDIQPIDKQILVNRYSPEGLLECSDFFDSSPIKIDKFENYKVTYPSNCKVLTLEAKMKKISLTKTKQEAY